jgi:hypothetical protein
MIAFKIELATNIEDLERAKLMLAILDGLIMQLHYVTNLSSSVHVYEIRRENDETKVIM